MLRSNFSNSALEAGCDEAGRGCLAGPVVAAAVVFPANFNNPLLNDSKQLSHKQREKLRVVIEQEALTYAVCMVSPLEIDRINILNASIAAMHLAIDSLMIAPDFLIIDGNRFTPYKQIPHKCIIKGDSLYMSIAAASILAKTYRDEYMVNLAKDYPMYLWEKNKGYPTSEHRQAIANNGITPHHRRTFKLTDNQLNLSF